MTAGLLALAAMAPRPSVACNRDRIRLTCDVSRIKPASYGLVTRGAALASAADFSFWETFQVDSPGRTMSSVDDALAFAAQRAAELDVTNAMAHATSARELLILGQPEMAEAAWHRVLENQGSVVWPAHIHGLGNASVLVEFGALDVRLYDRDRVAAQVASADGYWAAVAGCIAPGLRPDATMSWLNVRAIEVAKPGSLTFRLNEPLEFATSGKPRRVERLQIELQGLTARPSPNAVRPADTDFVRHLLTKFVDPDRRIELPSSNGL